MGISKKIASAAALCATSAKSVIKLAIESRPCGIRKAEDSDESLIIMGNGPSLADTMANHAPALRNHPLMAVNFAANAEEFYGFQPRYYVLADPVFFADTPHENVLKLWKNLSERIKWPMTLFVPAKMRRKARLSSNHNIDLQTFNPVGVEGFRWLENAAFASGRGMPRPRNVLIVAIMIALKMGYKNIWLTGADHSWTRTLEVDENNTVISVQPHFYKDNDAEHARVASVYKDIRLHQIMHSFYVAFRSYFFIRRFADHSGATIINATPGSFIDAFPRRQLSELD